MVLESCFNEEKHQENVFTKMNRLTSLRKLEDSEKREKELLEANFGFEFCSGLSAWFQSTSQPTKNLLFMRKFVKVAPVLGVGKLF